MTTHLEADTEDIVGRLAATLYEAIDKAAAELRGRGFPEEQIGLFVLSSLFQLIALQMKRFAPPGASLGWSGVQLWVHAINTLKGVLEKQKEQAAQAPEEKGN